MPKLSVSSSLSVARTLCFTGVALSVYSAVQALSVHEEVPADAGQHNRWQYIAHLAVACAGVLYNSLLIYLMLNLDSKGRFPFYTMNLFINWTDLASSLTRVIFRSISYHTGYILVDSYRCKIETFMLMFCAVNLVSGLTGISWVVRNHIESGKKYSLKYQLLFICVAMAYNTFCVSIAMHMGYEVDSSGAFCFFQMTWPNLLFFALATITTPRLFIIYNLKVTNKIIKTAQLELKAQGIEEQAKGHYIKMVKKLNIFVLFTMLQFLGVIGMGFYRYATLQYPPSNFSFTADLVVGFFSSIGNPTLFLAINMELRRTLWQIIGIRVVWVLSKFGLLSYIGYRLKKSRKDRPIWSSFIQEKVSIVSIVPQTVEVHPVEGEEDVENMEVKKNYTDIRLWLSEPDLFLAFKDLGRKEYSIENFLFYEEAKVYQAKGLALLDQVRLWNEGGSVDLDSLEKDWEEIEKVGLKIYSLYVKVPTSPLEINIPYSKRIIITKLYELDSASGNGNSATSSKIGASNGETERLLPTLSTLSKNNELLISTVTTYVTIYDNSIAIVLSIIETDLWPRFKKSEGFAKARTENIKMSKGLKPTSEQS